MKRVPGSSPLTSEAHQRFYRERFGESYSAIAENPLRQSRAVRRAQKFRGKRRARGLSDADAAVANQQAKLERQLRDSQIRPV